MHCCGRGGETAAIVGAGLVGGVFILLGRAFAATVRESGHPRLIIGGLVALAGVIVQEDLVAHQWLADHAADVEDTLEALAAVPVAEYCARSGVAWARYPTVVLYAATAGFATPSVFAVFENGEPDAALIGLVTLEQTARFSQRIFADLLPKNSCAPVLADTDLETLSVRMAAAAASALAVLDDQGQLILQNFRSVQLRIARDERDGADIEPIVQHLVRNVARKHAVHPYLHARVQFAKSRKGGEQRVDGAFVHA